MCGDTSLYIHALGTAGGLVQSIPQDGVLLLQAGQLSGGAVLQLILQALDLLTGRGEKITLINELHG